MAQFGFGTQSSPTTQPISTQSEAPANGAPERRRRWRDAAPQGPIGEPLLVLVIGVALVLVDQNSSEVSSMLRTPALLGGLVLASHGLNQLSRRWSGESEVEPVEPVESEHDAAARAAGLKPVEEDTSGPGVLPWILIILAVWLGLAALALPTAPLSLTLLSLLAAILLFSDGLKRMRADEA